MKLVYLAGPITGASYADATDWREDAIKRLAKSNIKGLSPMRGKFYLEKYEDIPDHLEEILSTAKGITARDRFDCLRCDVLLVNFVGAKRVSIGTAMEIAWADSKHTPIVVAIDKDNPHDHAMIRECSGFVLPTLKEALSIVEAILN
jgi:nucleoside 2-deoxyribosyltransferase